MAEKTSRVYLTTGDRLVRARNNSQARNFVSRNTIDVRVATQDDLLRLRSTAVEDATAEPTPEEGHTA